ncbi:Transmembrane protein [Melia azedarach]|uniref:Transmembrane protein n=1 Tax=Melia azedarach TaxID=155640 RepID=A0ACC1X978_MELAZ|nr:Transmembrane protein [Melia azedarach]
MATDSRESRRRKILERGSDRLAFITSRAAAAAPTPPPSELHDVPRADSLKPLISHEPRVSDQPTVSPSGGDEAEGDYPDSKILKQDSVADASHTNVCHHDERSVKSILPECGTSIETLSASSVVNGKEQSSLMSSDGNYLDSKILKQDSVADASHTNVCYHDERSVKSTLPECGTSIKTLSAPASVVNGKEQSSLISSTDQNSSVPMPSREQHLQLRRGQHKFFNPSQISSAISATERVRLLCSVAVALLVVLSYLGFPLLRNSIIKGILSFRPLYLVLLTNVTVVLSRLLFDHQGGFQRVSRGENNIPSDAYDWAAQASKALEVGLMMKKIDHQF